MGCQPAQRLTGEQQTSSRSRGGNRRDGRQENKRTCQETESSSENKAEMLLVSLETGRLTLTQRELKSEGAAFIYYLLFVYCWPWALVPCWRHPGACQDFQALCVLCQAGLVAAPSGVVTALRCRRERCAWVFLPFPRSAPLLMHFSASVIQLARRWKQLSVKSCHLLTVMCTLSENGPQVHAVLFLRSSSFCLVF